MSQPSLTNLLESSPASTLQSEIPQAMRGVKRTMEETDESSDTETLQEILRQQASKKANTGHSEDTQHLSGPVPVNMEDAVPAREARLIFQLRRNCLS